MTYPSNRKSLLEFAGNTIIELSLKGSSDKDSRARNTGELLGRRTTAKFTYSYIQLPAYLHR
jgi:hypothetical protein